MVGQRHIRSAMTVFMLALPVLVLVSVVFAIARDIPFWDDFEAAFKFLCLNTPDKLRHLLDFHNEHRIAIPRMIYWAITAIHGQIDFRTAIMCGDCLLIAYLALLGGQFARHVGAVVFIPFIWLFTDMANYENFLWSLTSIQSQGVMLFVLASLLFFERRDRPICLAGSLAFASAASLTSASGIIVWPCLVGMAVKDWLVEDGRYAWGRFADSTSLKSLFSPSNNTAFIACAIFLVLYFQGFSSHPGAEVDHSAEIAAYPHPILAAIDFFVTFCGAVVPHRAVALPLGIVVLVLIAYIVVNSARIKQTGILFLLAYTIGVDFSGAVMRSCMGGARAALFYRYEIVTITMAASVFFCMTVLWRDRAQVLWKWLLRTAIVLAVLANIAIFTFGFPFLLERDKLLHDGIYAWPEDITKLRCGDPQRDSTFLKMAVDAGIYTPPRPKTDGHP